MKKDKGTWYAKDGIIDVEEFNSQKIRILWILREPNGGGFDFMKYLSDVTVYPRWKQSYGLVVKVSRIFLNNLFDAENEWKVYDASIMKKIALINLKSTEGGSSVNWKEIEKSFDANKLYDRITNEIAPDIIICGGTYNYISSLPLEDIVVINLYHPNQRKITHKKYIEEAIKQYKRHYKNE